MLIRMTIDRGMSARTRGAELLKSYFDRDDARSQRDLAELLGVSQPSVSAWVRSTSRPEAHLREMLEVVVGIPKGAWLTDDEQMRLAEVLAQHRAGANDAVGLASTGSGG